MADTGRFQELSPTKIQEILDNAVSDKNEESHKVGMNMFNARIWEFQSKTSNRCYVYCRCLDNFITAKQRQKWGHYLQNGCQVLLAQNFPNELNTCRKRN